jgi:hypothetical protein
MLYLSPHAAAALVASVLAQDNVSLTRFLGRGPKMDRATEVSPFAVGRTAIRLDYFPAQN